MAPSKSPLDRVREAVKRADYRDAISAASAVPTTDLAREQISQLMDAMLTAAAGLSDGSIDELAAYDLVVRLGDRISRDDTFRPAVDLRVNAALFNKGVVLAQMGRADEAIAIYDELVGRTGGSRQLGLRENAVRALFNKGASLAALHRHEEAVGVYDELIGTFSSEPGPGMSEAVGKAMVNKGIALAELDRLPEAVGVLDEVIKRWSESTDPVLRERVVKALLNKAAALLQMGQEAIALNVYETIENLYGRDRAPNIREQVAIARVRREVLEESFG
ncbi:MAG: tetratricopeptide repeat protein [Gemmatimonadetes bacterium]|nr:tetratricopeptide repeat protein [Gemmatimonadota bacterium]NIO30612.1 tetratricopeptide repeat protein [Gemmatimonadota bacterium]